MVVEIPAGTNLKYEYDMVKNKFDVEIINEEPRRINYLPYPGNYGFIPSTLMDETKGGDGDPLDVLVIGSSIKQGSLIEFTPVGVLKLTDDGEEDHKIIGVVLNSKINTIDCKTLFCLQQNYPGILEIIETWFAEYKEEANVNVIGWANEEQANEMIQRWKVENP